MGTPLNILFLNPPGLPDTTANREAAAGMGTQLSGEGGFIYPPHSLAATAAAARAGGWSVSALDAQASGWDQDTTLIALSQQEPQIIAISTSWATWKMDVAFAEALRLAQPQAYLLAFGVSLHFVALELLSTGAIDGVLLGEAEGTIVESARALLDGATDDTHLLITTQELASADDASRGLVQNLDDVPFPAWDLLPVKQYPFLSILSSRGCSHGCHYCPYIAAQGEVFRAQSPVRTVEELSWLDREFHPERIVFRDPVFGHDRARVLALCRALRRAPIKAAWEVESRPEHFDREVLQALSSAGCRTIKLGVESTSPAVLQRVGRVADDVAARRYCDHARQVIGWCREFGIRCRAFAMTGLPGETIQDVCNTASDLARWQPHALHVKPYQWYPGIKLPRSEITDAQDRAAHVEVTWRQGPSLWQGLIQRILRWVG